MIRCIGLLLVALMYLSTAGCVTPRFSHRPFSSPAVKPPVPDGTIVLVRKGGVYGAFIPRDQKMSPENLSFEWYYRTDGRGRFGVSEARRVKHGSGVGGASRTRPGMDIRFGPFSIGWSGSREGYGFLYYDRFPGDSIQRGDLRICVTAQTDIEKIDATDPKWLYKASPSDVGIRSKGASRRAARSRSGN